MVKDFFGKYCKIFDGLFKVDVLVYFVFKYCDFYGEWGMIFICYVILYFWVLFFFVVILFIMIFKR